jgi:hypothetical protein
MDTPPQKIFLAGFCNGMMSFQLIVGYPETARREEVTAVTVVLKGAGFAYQPVDYMPVLNIVVARTP